MYLAIGVGALLASRVVRRLGTRRTFLAGASGLALVSLAFPLFPHLGPWFVLRGLAGAFAALFFVSTEVTIGLIGDPSKNARNLSFYGVTFSIGFSSGVGAWPFLERLGTWPPFLAAAAASGLAALLGPVLFPDIRPPAKERRSAPPPAGEKPRGIRGPLVAGFSYGFCESVVAALMAVYGIRIGFAPSTVGWYLVLIVGSGLLMHLPIGIAADRLGPLRLTRIAALLALAGVVLPLFRVSTATLVVCCVLAGIGVGALYTLGLAEVGRRVEPHALAWANARFTASYGIGSVLGPAVGGLLMLTIGPPGFFVALAACLAVLAVASMLSRPAGPLRPAPVRPLPAPE
jgi:MFS family permease